MKWMDVLATTLFLLCASFVFPQTFSSKKRLPRPHEYGNVVMNNYSEENDIAPVEFNHWLHRAKYTCTVCHVDLGFAMSVGETGVHEEDNQDGLFCGACHNGKSAFGFGGETAPEGKNEICVRCHNVGKEMEIEVDFYDFVGNLPRARFGNRVDWVKAAEQELIEVQDAMEGISSRREDSELPVSSVIDAKVPEMPDVVFSHVGHAVWTGCQLCHPQLFEEKNGATVFEMQDNFDGNYCGTCHGKVAFPTMNCRRCHAGGIQ